MKVGKQWTLDQIFQYSYNNYNTMWVNYYKSLNLPVPKSPPDATAVPDPAVLKMDYLNQLKANAALFANYNPALYGGQSANIAQWNNAVWGNNSTSDPNLATPAVPYDHINPNALDPGNNVLLGWNFPFHKGAIHIHVRNNNDSGTKDSSGNSGSPFHDTDGLIMVTVTATLPSGLQRQIDGTISSPPLPPPGAPPFSPLGAVVAKDSVSTNGNTTIDGRDYLYSPTTGATTTLSGNPGVPGIVSGTSINVGGSSGVGGNMSAPPSKGAALGSTQIDPFSSGYPPTADDLLGVQQGTMKSLAQAAGTYCATATDYSNLLAANGGSLPSHAIIYLDFTPGSGVFELGSGNTLSSYLVVHTDSYTGTIGEVHGTFTGAIFADSVVRVNAGTSITGMVQLFNPASSTTGNVLGNGNSNIRFSSAALGDLPQVVNGSPPALPLVGSRRTL